MFASYLRAWLLELCEWIRFNSGERREHRTGFQAIAGATLGHKSAATTMGSTYKRGVNWVVANTHGVFHTRWEPRDTLLATVR